MTIRLSIICSIGIVSVLLLGIVFEIGFGAGSNEEDEKEVGEEGSKTSREAFWMYRSGGGIDQSRRESL